MSQDDLGFLVESFNAMTQRIAQSSDETRAASMEVEHQRAYLETVLSNLTAGVISFSDTHTIRTANQATYRILHIQASHFVGKTLLDIAKTHTELAQLLNNIQILLQQAEDIWEHRFAFLSSNGRQELLCRGTPLFDYSGGRVGAIVVFNDITDLIQAQKNAAWAEVARRLAHEIKNPLTPIQLAAERLQHKLSAELSATHAQILLRSTQTIVNQVEALKSMVDDFSEYAKPSKELVEHINLNKLVNEVLLLYLSPTIHIKTTFQVTNIMINANPVSIRQVLHNLLKNAQEAIPDNGQIEITLNKVFRHNSEYVELTIYDNGSGLDEQQIIIEEHGGVIWADTTYNEGAGFIIQLPTT